MDGRGAYGQYLDSIAQYDQSLIQQACSNNPSFPGYNPTLVSAPTDDRGAHAYNPTAAAAATAAQHHHHSLLMSVAAAGYGPAAAQESSRAMAILGNAGLGYAAGAPAFHQTNALAAALNFDPLPLGGAAAAAAAAAASAPLPPDENQSSRAPASAEDFLLLNGMIANRALSPMPPQPCRNTTPPPPTAAATRPPGERWLEDLKASVPGLSLEPMSGTEIVSRVRTSMDDVITRYLPCVDFLVQCQQDLRKGLNFAQAHKRSRRYGLSARQFYATYVHPLPQQFQMKNQFMMEATALDEAMRGLHKLCDDAKNAERLGCEAVKNNFLGGMKDGESWGLRKWLSKNGNALRICTDVECILESCRKLDKADDQTRKLAAILRPLSEQTLQRLKGDVPQSYQEHSSAHPYLPFFHRLESCLRAMSSFNPDDDDVICIDDSDDDEPPPPKPTKPSPKAKPRAKPKSEGRKRKAQQQPVIEQEPPPPAKRPAAAPAAACDDSSSGESDDDSVIEVVGVKPADGPGDDGGGGGGGGGGGESCPFCIAAGGSALCHACSLQKQSGADQHAFLQAAVKAAAATKPTPQWPVALTAMGDIAAAAEAMAQKLEELASVFEQSQQHSVRPHGAPFGSFWDGERYGGALRLFSSLLRHPESPHFVERVEDDTLIQNGAPPYTHVIKHPLCFRDIAASLLHDIDDLETGLEGHDGQLPVRGLSSWNMWKGMDLLQALDLVFLNSLAYGRAVVAGRSQHRSKTNKLRKQLWDGIQGIIQDNVGGDNERRKQCTPTRRSESSGFVVYKIQGS